MAHSEKVTRYLSFRCQHDKTTWMSILLKNRVVGIMKTDFVSDLPDRRLRSRQKMPALSCARASVASEVSPLLSRSQGGILARADAGAQHVELLANAPFHVLQRLHQTVEAQR